MEPRAGERLAGALRRSAVGDVQEVAGGAGLGRAHARHQRSERHGPCSDARVDWQALLVPHHVAENVLRATVVFWMLFLLLRFLPNRKAGGVGPTDLLVVVLLANAVQAAIQREGFALTDAAIQV